jgi:hypothetical protein
MDHTCNMIQISKTMKGIFCSVKRRGGVYIAISAFVDMDRLPDFDEMMAHPALLVPQTIPVDEDAILPDFPNVVEAVPGEFNATQFGMAHSIHFDELQAHVALHIWPQSIKISPDQSQTIYFVTLKYSPKIVCQNRPRKIMTPVCLPWRTVYLTVCLMPCKISLNPCMNLWTTFLLI